MRAVRRLLLLSCTCVVMLTVSVSAEDKKPSHAAVSPVDRKEKSWQDRHSLFLDRAKKGDVAILFLGDSITHGWAGAGKSAWEKHFEPLKAANFGIGGDRTQHVLWRITEGKELEGIHPKAAVIMIGTNNMNSDSVEQIADGVTAIVHALHKTRPETKVLLLGIFPRSAKSTDAVRAKIKDVNSRIAKLDDGKVVFYRDIGNKFLSEDGSLSKDIMPDALHLSPRGYEIWVEAIKPDLEKLLN